MLIFIFAEISGESSAGMPMISSISFLTRGASAAGRSILVDDRHDLQTGVNGKIGVAERLRLNTLCRINNQKRTLTRCQRTRNLIVEVHMSRGVDQVHFVGLAVVRGIFHADSARLDGNAALALKLHIVE